jgi:excisionase family DNA binding protein
MHTVKTVETNGWSMRFNSDMSGNVEVSGPNEQAASFPGELIRAYVIKYVHTLDRYGTVADAAAELGVGEATIRRYLHEGTINGRQLGSTWLVDLDDVFELADSITKS